MSSLTHTLSWPNPDLSQGHLTNSLLLSTPPTASLHLFLKLSISNHLSRCCWCTSCQCPTPTKDNLSPWLPQSVFGNQSQILSTFPVPEILWQTIHPSHSLPRASSIIHISKESQPQNPYKYLSKDQSGVPKASQIEFSQTQADSAFR